MKETSKTPTTAAQAIKMFFDCSNAELLELRREDKDGYEEIKKAVMDHYGMTT